MARIRTIDFPAPPVRAIIAARGGGPMYANEYLLECLVRERLQMRRTEARRAARLAAARGPRDAWRVTLGLVLIRLGRALVGEPARRARHA
jgi:hypothetical protein